MDAVYLKDIPSQWFNIQSILPFPVPPPLPADEGTCFPGAFAAYFFDVPCPAGSVHEEIYRYPPGSFKDLRALAADSLGPGAKFREVS